MGGLRGPRRQRGRALTLTRSLVFVIPGDLDARTGGYGYDRRIIAGLRERHWSVAVARLGDSFPQPTGDDRVAASRVFAGIPDGSLVLVDGLALGALPDEAGRERDRLRLVALVHHPLADETGLSPDVAAMLEASERRALESVQHVVVTSRVTARTLDRFGVDRDRISVIEPGTDPAPLARRYRTGHTEPGGELHLLTVASVTPRKDYETLIGALGTLSDRPWRLRCAGAFDRDVPTVRRVFSMIDELRLGSRIAMLGDLDEAAVAAEYDRADLFVLPTRYEGYGMAVAEALARGLPVISTPTGAIPDLVTTHAGILVPPGDVNALAAALTRVMDDGALRERLGDAARAVRGRLPTWSDAAAKVDTVLLRFAGHE